MSYLQAYMTPIEGVIMDIRYAIQEDIVATRQKSTRDRELEWQLAKTQFAKVCSVRFGRLFANSLSRGIDGFVVQCECNQHAGRLRRRHRQ